MNYSDHYDSPLGGITLVSDGIVLTGLWFDGQKRFAATLASESKQSPNLPIFEQTRHWLDLYFAGHCPDFTPPLAPQGTPFQQKVWKMLLAIPYGKTVTYGEIAQRVVETCHGASLQGASLQGVSLQDTSLQETSSQGTSQPKRHMSAQAIGGAVGRNPIAIIIPCHRVIGANGSLTGYAGGLERKEWLLQLESSQNKHNTNLLEYTRRSQLRQWLTLNHRTVKECWVTVNRSKEERTDCIPYIEVVEEALCFGWIDSTVKRLPDGRCAQRLSPRRKKSHWTELNLQRCQNLIERGLMTEAGRLAMPQKRTIRKAALPNDGQQLMKVFAAAKAIMVASGNKNQWKDGYPSLEIVRSDMEKEGGFVVEDNGQIVAYFAFLPSPEPTYAQIYYGQWIDDMLPYHVIHRIASFPEVHGIFHSIMEFCFERERNIRIDTHRDNHIMQHNILKHGFQYCGIILLANGDERLAYQKMI